MVRALVKVHAGLRQVDAAAYLRQARQILEADSSASAGWTHPELQVRIACLAARHLAGAGEVTRHLIDGSDDLDRLDLLAQRRLQQLSAQVLTGVTPIVAALPEAPVDQVELHLTTFDSLDVSTARPLDDGALADASSSVRNLAAALVLDVAMLLRREGAALDDLKQLSIEARRIGVGDEFHTLLTRTAGAAGAARTAGTS